MIGDNSHTLHTFPKDEVVKNGEATKNEEVVKNEERPLFSQLAGIEEAVQREDWLLFDYAKLKELALVPRYVDNEAVEKGLLGESLSRGRCLRSFTKPAHQENLLKVSEDTFETVKE